jgi:membrane-anchored glycerophosphoryl diester phosphodiesterase (GDPDase)
MKKSGGFVPGIRPGKPTAEYLEKVVSKMIVIGAVGLIILALIPIVCSGLFNANVSFGGTSIIIIVGVVIGRVPMTILCMIAYVTTTLTQHLALQKTVETTNVETETVSEPVKKENKSHNKKKKK